MKKCNIRGLNPAELREVLGADFSQEMPTRINRFLNVDVLVLDLVGDAYCIESAGQQIIVVKRTTSWFRQNFSLAHELAHLAIGSLHYPDEQVEGAEEQAANAFAAELLMPAERMREFDWMKAGQLEAVAQLLWDLGVSVTALQVRLETLEIQVCAEIAQALKQNTVALLREHGNFSNFEQDAITLRRERALERRVPVELSSSLEMAVLAGKAPVESLAFALGTSPADLEMEEESAGVSAEVLNYLDELLDS